MTDTFKEIGSLFGREGTGSGSSGLTGSLCRTETNGSPPSRMRNVRTCRWDGFRLLCMESNP